MPNIVIANSQKRKILEEGRAFLDTLELRLYKTNITLSGTVMPVAGTDEPTDSGYTVESNPFPNACDTASNQGRAVGIAPTWTFAHDAGDFTLYGCFWTDPADSDVTVMACASGSPFAIVAPGQVFVASTAFILDTYTP